MKGGFEKYRDIGDGICGIKILKQNTRERNWNNQYKLQEDEQKPLKKVVAKCFMRGQGKNRCTKNKLNLLSKNSIKNMT